MSRYERRKISSSLLSDFPTISFGRKSNAFSFAKDLGEKEKSL